MTPTPQQIAETILQRIRSAPALPGRIPLSVYETQLDYETLRPEDRPATVQQHRDLIDAVAAILRRELPPSVTVDLVTLDAAAYLRWLAATGKSNAADTRAEYIATAAQQAPRARPDAQLVVKLSREEMEAIKELPKITGDRGLSALARRLLLAELARLQTPPAEWTREMDALLGTDKDGVIADRLGKTRDQVIRRRKHLGIASFGKPGRPANAPSE